MEEGREGGKKEKIADLSSVVRGNVYLFCSQLVELSKTFSHFLLGGRKLNVGRQLPFPALASNYGGVSRRENAFLNALGGARCPHQQLTTAATHPPPNPGSNLKAVKGE